MDMQQTISTLATIMNRRILSLPERFRLFTKNTETLPRAISLTGPRGVGKTTFLLYHAQKRNMLYLSADNPLLAGTGLYDIATAVFMNGYSGVIVDEVHFAKDWSLHLKALYDDYPDHSIWTSDSSSMILRKGVADLSRRYVKIEMPLLSFREFLYLETGTEYPIHNPFVHKEDMPVTPTPEILRAFNLYKTGGTRPFYRENDYEDRLLSVLEKTLYFDIPFFIPNITDGNLRLMKAITASLATSTIPRLSVNSLCADWSIGSDKLYQLLEVMDAVSLLRIIRKENDTKSKSAGKKLFLSDPAFYPALNGSLGNAREAMVAMLCANAGWDVEAARDESSGDFAITKHRQHELTKITLEVGGPAKKIKKADFVIRDDIDVRGKNTIPLWLLGMMY